MDVTTRLISELESKLAELDSKVAAYQQDMTAEFQRYSDQLLHTVPSEISDSVSRALVRSRSKYRSLYPDADADAEASGSPGAANTDDEERRWCGRKSPPPALHHTSGPKDASRNPHEREKEFRGVFTPNYLPLLDGGETAAQSPPLPPSPASPFVGDGKMAEPSPTTDSPTDFTRRPPVRRLTDSSSVDSSSSDAKTRRSALRRSSSASNRPSPRRVRFDVQGEEVSPTATPQASTMGLAHLGGDDPPRGLAGDSEPSSSKLRFGFDDDLDPQPARKVSSTERLRALSKLPLENPSKWRYVPQPDADDSAVVNAEGAGSVTNPPTADPPAQVTGKAPEGSQPAGRDMPAAPRIEMLGSPLQDLEQHDDEDSSEDDYISMRPSKKSPVSPSSRSPVSPSPATAQTMKPSVPPAAHSSAHPEREVGTAEGSSSEHGVVNGHYGYLESSSGLGLRSGGASSDEDELEADQGRAPDDEALFEFDEDARSPPRKKRSPRAAKMRSYRSSEGASADDEAPTSPGVGIPQKRASPPIQPSAGSYRGRQITTFDVVRDFRVHEKAAELGDFNSFVGSVDGRTGADHSDANSFRASMNSVQYSGTPRSLSERLAMDEARERMERDER